jgi:hypothetical protein
LEFLVGGFYEIPFGYWGDIDRDLERLLASNAELVREQRPASDLADFSGRASGSAAKWS